MNDKLVLVAAFCIAGAVVWCVGEALELMALREREMEAAGL